MRHGFRLKFSLALIERMFAHVKAGFRFHQADFNLLLVLAKLLLAEIESTEDHAAIRYIQGEVVD